MDSAESAFRPTALDFRELSQHELAGTTGTSERALSRGGFLQWEYTGDRDRQPVERVSENVPAITSTTQ